MATRNQSRTQKSADTAARGSRALEDHDRVNDAGTELTLEEQRQLLRNEFQQEALPTVPEIPGYHLCWLSSTSSYDPIHKRMRIGYRPVRAEELIGFEQMRMKSGEFEGCISCNEMLLFKIPTEIYQRIMQEFHHNMPLEEEQALKSRLIDENARDSRGKKLGQITEDSDGYEELARSPRQGVFAN